MRMTLLITALLALFLTACQAAPPTAEADSVEVLEAVAELDQRVNVLAANVDVLSTRVADMDERLWSRLQVLIGAATDLHALVQQPISIADVDLTNVEGLLVTTTADVINFLAMAPGACPEDLSAPRAMVAAGELVVSAFWPAPTGPHCISTAGGEGYEAFGVTIDVPPGTVGGVALLPPE